jgi:hypothetical protein
MVTLIAIVLLNLPLVIRKGPTINGIDGIIVVRRRQSDLLRNRRITSISDAVENIRICLEALSVRLATRSYFFDDRFVSKPAAVRSFIHS